MEIGTQSGKLINLMYPNEEDIDIADIAHALSNIGRWGGHTSRFYSVAQHSVECVNLVLSTEIKRWMLMHDACEAYLGDLVSPIKELCPQYKAVEERMQVAIAKRFDLVWPMPSGVHAIDAIMLATEHKQLMPRLHMLSDWRPRVAPNNSVVLQPKLPAAAKADFLYEYELLWGDEDGGDNQHG